MPRKERDYRAEYQRRVERGRERGLSLSQARGHAKPDETPILQLRKAGAADQGLLSKIADAIGRIFGEPEPAPPPPPPRYEPRQEPDVGFGPIRLPPGLQKTTSSGQEHMNVGYIVHFKDTSIEPYTNDMNIRQYKTPSKVLGTVLAKDPDLEAGDIQKIDFYIDGEYWQSIEADDIQDIIDEGTP